MFPTHPKGRLRYASFLVLVLGLHPALGTATPENGRVSIPEAYLKAGNAGADDEFGWSVAMSGDTLVVGARGEASNDTLVNASGTNNDAANAGAAYVFIRTPEGWSQQAYLKADNADQGDRFGTSVAIDGNTLVIGASGESSDSNTINGSGSNDNASSAGAAYVFVRDGSQWSQQAYLKADNAEEFDRFGRAVAIDGDTVVVGAAGEDSNANIINGNGDNNSASSAGAAYVFVREGTSWTQQAYLKADNPGDNDRFGYAVDLSGNHLVVGANGQDLAGAAYVFVRDSLSWSQQAFLKGNNTTQNAGDEFGNAVAIDANTVVVGARDEASTSTTINVGGDNNDAPAAGAAYVFVRDNNTWTQQAYLKASNAEAGDFLGESVAIAGDTVVVGAPFESSAARGVNGDGANNEANASGAAYVFVREGINWTQQDYVKANNGDAFDWFGQNVAVSNGILVVGANFEDSNATGVDGDIDNNDAQDAGAVYVFDQLPISFFQDGFEVIPPTQ